MNDAPDLILAWDSDVKRYEDSGSFSGLPDTLRDLERHPLAIEQRGRPTGMDHIHLSVSDQHKYLVRWSGRGQSGYHYPIGRVMVILHAADQLGIKV